MLLNAGMTTNSKRTWLARLLLGGAVAVALAACSPADVFHPTQANAPATPTVTTVQRPKAQTRVDTTRTGHGPQTTTTLQPLPAECYIDVNNCLTP